jgi:hypothetical protein
MEESIERSAVFGEIERGKSFDVADDSFGHVAGVEQQSIGQRQGQCFHVLAHFGQQHQSPFEQGRRALFTEVALIAKELASEILRELFHRHAVVDIAGSHVDLPDAIVGSARFLNSLIHNALMPPIPVVGVKGLLEDAEFVPLSAA